MLLLFEILQVLSAVLLILMVLMHSAKGDGIASIGGSAQMFKSSGSQLEQGLNIATAVLAFIFLASSALLGWGVIK